jgi:transcriptional regulator with XRE-family HTH domain
MSTKFFEKDLTNLNADLSWHDTVPGAFLRKLRKDRGYSLTRLETLSGVSDSEIHRVETGQQDCGIQSLVRLCAALGTTPGYILDRALASKRGEIQNRILADPDFLSLKSRLAFATPERIASFADALIHVCQAFSVLLRCSDPVSFVKNFRFPLPEWEKGFSDFAARLASIGEGVDRASMMYGLLANPVRELKSQGLLPDALLTPEGLQSLPHGQPDGFDMTAKPEPGDSYLISENLDGTASLKQIVPDRQS